MQPVMSELSAVLIAVLVGVALAYIDTTTDATTAAATDNDAEVRFRVEPHSRTCSFGEEVELICAPMHADAIHWVKNSTDDHVINDGGISRLSFPCQNVYLQCCYTLGRQDFCGEMVVIVMREFAAQPEDVTCFSSNFHYAYFHCIPSNTSFLSIDWYINGSIGEKTSSSRHDQMKMKLNCSQLYSNTSIQCAVRYSETCLYSRNASLCVEDAGLASIPEQGGNLQESGSSESTTPQNRSYISTLPIAFLGTSLVVQTVITAITVIALIEICRRLRAYKQGKPQLK